VVVENVQKDSYSKQPQSFRNARLIKFSQLASNVAIIYQSAENDANINLQMCNRPHRAVDEARPKLLNGDGGFLIETDVLFGAET
jgi:hypothetical protein